MSSIEENIIRKAQSRDSKAQTVLYNKYKRIWYSTCLRYNKNKFDAEDCLQSSIVSIFSNLHQFDANKGAFSTWSTRIVINTNIHFLKNKENHYSVDYGQTLDYLNAKSQEKETKFNFNGEKLKTVIQKLPSGYRTVFNLYVMEGYDHIEISEILNISIGTSKSQLSKAKNFLRKSIGDIHKIASA